MLDSQFQREKQKLQRKSKKKDATANEQSQTVAVSQEFDSNGQQPWSQKVENYMAEDQLHSELVSQFQLQTYELFNTQDSLSSGKHTHVLNSSKRSRERLMTEQQCHNGLRSTSNAPELNHLSSALIDQHNSISKQSQNADGVETLDDRQQAATLLMNRSNKSKQEDVDVNCSSEAAFAVNNHNSSSFSENRRNSVNSPTAVKLTRGSELKAPLLDHNTSASRNNRRTSLTNYTKNNSQKR